MENIYLFDLLYFILFIYLLDFIYLCISLFIYLCDIALSTIFTKNSNSLLMGIDLRSERDVALW